jgi:hypothetical protein
MASKLDANQVIQASRPEEIVHGQKSVAQTAVTLQAAAAELAVGVWVKSDSGNTGNIFVGETGVTTSTGYKLEPGESMFINIEALLDIYVISNSGTNTVYYFGS